MANAAAATSDSRQQQQQHSVVLHVNSVANCMWLCLQVAIGLGALLWGPASDRYGRRPVLLIATALFALTNVPLILAPDVAVLLAFRTLQVGRDVGSSSWCNCHTSHHDVAAAGGNANPLVCLSNGLPGGRAG